MASVAKPHVSVGLAKQFPRSRLLPRRGCFLPKHAPSTLVRRVGARFFLTLKLAPDLVQEALPKVDKVILAFKQLS